MKGLKFKKGAPLASGDTIGVIAPASACEPERLKSGVEFLKSQGFKVKVVLNPAKYYGRYDHLFSSDAPEKRAKALHELFKDDSVRAIITARGAYGSAEILPLLDLKKIQKTPKILVGFSDITALLSGISSQAEMVCIHGPMVSGAFANAAKDKQAMTSAQMLLAMLSGEVDNPFSETKLIELKSGKAAQGHIIGGSLSVLSSLIGTPWEPNFSGAILFLEETGEKPFRIHRQLLSLELAGKLKDLKGVVLGQFVKCEHTQGPDVNAVVKSIFANYKYPVYAGLPAGHGELNLPVPIGVMAELSGGRLNILESPVELS